ncbi:YaaC family protein [Oceanobacillus sp. 1P07AA]|uniref:YaaC family protein n=1 Tax=Oceanobacillus sp. 1P07AA TaxID=3132293 RepID=UPI0039A5A1A9
MTEANQLFIHLSAQENAQSFLHKCYQNIDEQTKKSYQNGTAFMHYIQHGLQFYKSGEESSPIVRPVLYFYGMVHLLKGWILTKRPNYPESTALLAHGVTSRKRKRKDYQFFDDEVKIQQQGLFPYFTKHMYHFNSFPLEKASMRLLLANIPELQLLWGYQQKKTLINIGEINSDHLLFPMSILDHFHLTRNAFVQRIRPFLPSIKEISEQSSSFKIDLAEKIVHANGPFFVHMDNQQLYFPTSRDIYLPYSEIITHYLILYNLSMLCRYETEWWGELMVSKADSAYPMIEHFLEITRRKIPYLIEKELHSIYSASNGK